MNCELTFLDELWRILGSWGTRIWEGRLRWQVGNSGILLTHRGVLTDDLWERDETVIFGFILCHIGAGTSCEAECVSPRRDVPGHINSRTWIVTGFCIQIWGFGQNWSSWLICQKWIAFCIFVLRSTYNKFRSWTNWPACWHRSIRSRTRYQQILLDIINIFFSAT